jgi:hypothetical protein
MVTRTKPKEIPKPPVKYVRERDPYKVVLVSPKTHARFKEFAQKTGYKLQYIADVALEQYIKQQEAAK